jgi:Fic family protein
VLNNLLDSPILYLSQYIINSKQAYYALLQDIRDKNKWEEFILYILSGIEETSENTLNIVKKINALFADTVEKIKSQLPKIYSKELVELLFYEFYTKINFLVDGLGVTRKTASSYLVALEEIGILQSEKIGKERIFKNVGLFNLVKEEAK